MSRLLFLVCLCTVLIQQCFGQSSFVSLAGRQFMKEGQPFYPRVMNFNTELMTMNSPVTDVDDLWLAVESNYDWAFQQYEPTTEAGFRQQVTDHFAKIASMGFNTVRLGLPALMHWDAINGPRHYSVAYLRYVQWEKRLLELDMNGFNDAASLRHFAILRDVIQLADAAGLKVILLCAQSTSTPGTNHIQLFPTTDLQAAQDYASYLRRLAEELKDEPGLLAYDLWNEPIWTNLAMTYVSKSTVCEYTTMWYDAIREAGDVHLVTLGGIAISELGSWDPAIMKLDFYSPHIYPEFTQLDGYNVQAGFDRYLAKIHWQSRTCPIPWLIGETGFAAEDDDYDPKYLANPNDPPYLIPDLYTHRLPYMHGSEAQQAEFFTNSMDAVRENLGSGYSWWGFQNGRNHRLFPAEDFEPGNTDHRDLVKQYHHNFWGPLKYGNPAGLNLPPPNNGAPWNVQNRWRDKAMVETMQNYTLPPSPTELPAPPSNYYNWYNLNTEIWHDGYVKDQNDQPVADAVIEVPWSYALNTITQMPAWDFTEFMPYVTDENGHYSLLEGPILVNYSRTLPLFAQRTVNAAGAATRPLDPDGTTEIVRDFLPYSSDVHVVVLDGENEIYRGRVDLAVLTGTVEVGGQAEVVAGHSVHLSAPFHAEQGSEAHIHILPVFKDCREEGSGIAQPPTSSQGELASAKSRAVSIALRFEAPGITASAYPNPATDHITLRCDQRGFAYTIYDARGSVVDRGQTASEFIAMDISWLSPGEYRVSLAQGSLVANTSFTIAR